MKKSIKVCLILGIVFVTLGLGVSVSAAAMGASAAGIKVPFVYYMNDGLEHNLRVTSKKAMEETSSFANINKLEIDGRRGDLRFGYLGFAATEGTDQITVSVNEGNGSCRVVQNRDELKVDYRGKKRYYNTDVSKDYPQVEVGIPEGYRFREVEMDLGESDCIVDSINADKLDLSTGVGNLEISNGNVGQLDIDGAVGNIVYQGVVTGDIDINSGVGAITLQLQGKETDYNYNINCGVGEVTVGSQSFGGLASSRKINNNASRNMDLDCSVGSIQISFVE